MADLLRLYGTLPQRFLAAVRAGEIDGPEEILDPLVAAFEAIADGEDANRALGLTAPRGRPSGSASKKIRDQRICDYVRTKMADGASKNEAIAWAEDRLPFPAKESTIRRALKEWAPDLQ